jgi:RNA polymerase sigma factor (sigma-70 family)
MKSAIDPDSLNIMKKICKFGLYRVCDKSEIESLMLFTYVRCKKLYDESKSTAKFTSYVYRAFLNNSRSLYNKKTRHVVKNKNLAGYKDPKTEDHEAFFILESLKEKNEQLYTMLIQKYYYNMTNKEIAKVHGISHYTVGKKLKKAIDKCREIVYS